MDEKIVYLKENFCEFCDKDKVQGYELTVTRPQGEADVEEEINVCQNCLNKSKQDKI